jgi:hypothetical protein
LTNKQNEFLELLQFRKVPYKCIDYSGVLGQSIEIYLSSLIFTDNEIDKCIDVIKQHKSNWEPILEQCGYHNVSKAINQVRKNNFELMQKYSGNNNEVKHYNRAILVANSKEDRTMKLLYNIVTNYLTNTTTNMIQDKQILESYSTELDIIQSSISQYNIDIQNGIVRDVDEYNKNIIKERKIMGMMNVVKYRCKLKEHLLLLSEVYNTHNNLDDNNNNDNNNNDNNNNDNNNNNSDYSKEDEMSTVTTVTTDTPRTLQDDIDLFNDWFKAGVEYHSAVNKLEAKLIPNYRIGTIATDNITVEDIYLVVPLNLILDVNMAIVDNSFGPFLQTLEKKFKRRDNFHELLLYLVYEYVIKRENSFFWPYLTLLPKPEDMDIPLMWNESVLYERLHPSDIYSNIMEYKYKVYKTYEAIMKVDLISNFMSSVILTYERYAWATAILDSRAIWWSGVRHLVPMLDFVNCQESPNTRVHSTTLEKFKEPNDDKSEIISKTEDGQTKHEVLFDYAGAVTRAGRLSVLK